MKQNKNIYIFNYILIILLYHYVKYVGIESIFSMRLYIIPIANYLALKFGVFNKLEKDPYINKNDIYFSFLLITTIFNIIFFYCQKYELQTITIIVISNILEFIFIKTKRNIVEDKTQKNIEEYFKSKNS